MTVLSWSSRQKNYWSAIRILDDWKLLCFAWKWHGGKTRVLGLDDMSEKALVSKLHELFEEADIIIGHNGDKFDIKKAKAKFLQYKLKPTPPNKTIDTIKLARKHFSLESYRLDDLGEFLGVGRKIDTGGIQLWLDVMANDPKAWKKMKRYNKQDVDLLEAVYEELSPWMHNHPNLNLVNDSLGTCPLCGKDDLQKRGYGYSMVSKYQRYRCMSCGKWSRGSVIRTDVTIR